ncbi:Plasma membrane t-SNARE, secretory vesicle fusion [Ascosphaera pollenicola]|nr:Plasma membrane t-SNARE, secretory vesicle fusion [Ascosphaera pollenicola]
MSAPKRIDVLRRQVALYDATLQDLDAVKDLPGVMGDEELVAELEAKKSYFQTLRCVAIARSHAIVSKPQNALALLVRASKLTEQAAPLSRLPDQHGNEEDAPLRLDITPSQLQTLTTRLQGLVLHHQALCELARLQDSANKLDQRDLPPLVERLDTYPLADVDLKHLVNFPPQMQPIPVKPLFLDIAYNYLEYPGSPASGTSGLAVGGAAASGRRGTAPASAPGIADGAAVGTGSGNASGGQGDEAARRETKRGWFGFGRR